jgi:hypothetical protein
MKLLRLKLTVWSPIFALVLIACGRARQQSQSGLTPEEARQIAKDAYICGFPLATNYRTMYKQTIDKANPDYRASFNFWLARLA